MPIHVILGKPGSGKSLYATSRIIEELANGTRNIVTNVPLNLGLLNEYLQKRWPNVDCRMIQRVRVLTDDEMREFWKYRGPDIEGADIEGKDGVAYFLDEAHLAFNAREWATLGKGALHYLSQHRKLGDIVWPITQAPGNLDKQFRSVAEDFTVIRNEYTAKYGPFRGRGRFVRRTYLSEPSGNAEPFEKATFTLDGVKECYNTAKGVGVHGSKADIGRRAKGWSIWWAFAGAFALAALVGLVPWLLGKGASAAMTGGAAKKIEATAGKIEAGTVGASMASHLPGAGGGAMHDKPVPVVEPVADSLPPENPLYVTGWVRKGHKVNVQLSDGRVLTESDPELTAINRNSVNWDGKRIWIMRPASVASLAPPLPSPLPLPMPSTGLSEGVAASPESSDAWSASTGPVGIPSGRIGR